MHHSRNRETGCRPGRRCAPERAIWSSRANLAIRWGS